MYTESIGVRLKPQLLPLRCDECRKIDERGALSMDLGPVAVMGKTDLFHTAEDVWLCKRSVAGRLVELGVQGVERVEIGVYSHVALWPTLLVSTERSKTGMKVHGGDCGNRGRPREVTGFPRLSSMALPEAKLALFASECWSESRRGRRVAFIANALTVRLLKAEKITGFEACPAEP